MFNFLFFCLVRLIFVSLFLSLPPLNSPVGSYSVVYSKFLSSLKACVPRHFRRKQQRKKTVQFWCCKTVQLGLVIQLSLPVPPFFVSYPYVNQNLFPRPPPPLKPGIFAFSPSSLTGNEIDPRIFSDGSPPPLFKRACFTTFPLRTVMCRGGT